MVDQGKADIGIAGSTQDSWTDRVVKPRLILAVGLVTAAFLVVVGVSGSAGEVGGIAIQVVGLAVVLGSMLAVWLPIAVELLRRRRRITELPFLAECYLIVITLNAVWFTVSTGRATGNPPALLVVTDTLNAVQFGALMLAAGLVVNGPHVVDFQGKSKALWTASWLLVFAANVLAALDSLANLSLHRDWIIVNAATLVLLSGGAMLALIRQSARGGAMAAIGVASVGGTTIMVVPELVLTVGFKLGPVTTAITQLMLAVIAFGFVVSHWAKQRPDTSAIAPTTEPSQATAKETAG